MRAFWISIKINWQVRGTTGDLRFDESIQNVKNTWKENQYKNHLIKRFCLKDLLGQDTKEYFTNLNDNFLSESESKKHIHENSISCLSSKKGVYVSFIRGLSVSSNGKKVWANHIDKYLNKKYTCKLLMVIYEAKTDFIYKYKTHYLKLYMDSFSSKISGSYWLKTFR